MARTALDAFISLTFHVLMFHLLLFRTSKYVVLSLFSSYSNIGHLHFCDTVVGVLGQLEVAVINWIKSW